MALGGNVTDIGIMDGATELGLMLARDSSGRLMYREKEMQPFSFMQAAGYIDESSQNPGALYPLAFQKSWVGGFGQAFMKSDEPRRYFASYGVDASEDGVLKLGPDWTAIAWPDYSPTTGLTDGAMETWASSTDLTNWTETLTGTGTVTQETVTVHQGSNSCKLVGSSASNYAEISQSIAWDVAYRGKQVRVSIWVYEVSNAQRIQLLIYDGQETATATSSATAGAWKQLTLTKTIHASATELTVKIRHSTTISVTAYVDDATFVILGATNSYAEYGGLQHMASGNTLYKANSATAPTAWTWIATFIRDITAIYSAQVSGTAYLFIMLGSGNTASDKGWYYDGTTLTQMTDAGGTDSSGKYMTSASTTFYISGRSTGVTTGAQFVIRTNTAPLAGAWSADTNVGDPNTNITGLANVNNVIYIAKEDSLWKVNTDGTVSIVVDYKFHFSSTSGVGVTGWNNKVYIPVGANALLEYDPDNTTYSNISPAATASSVTQAQISAAPAILSAIQTDFDGRIMTVTGGVDFLWVLQDNGSVNNLFKGQYSNIDGVGWHWHPVANTTMGDSTAMATSLLTNAPIIWVGHGTANPGYYDLAKYETSDPTYTNPMIITPYYTGGVWRMMKALYSIILGLESITAAVYVTLQYRFYGTAAWSTALTFDGAAGTVSNGQDSNYMPADSYGTAIQFRLNFISNANTSTPKVTRINGEGIIKPAEVSVIECTVVLQDNQVTRTGMRDTMPASRKRTGLNTIRALNWPATAYDITGASMTVDLVTREDVAAPEVKLIGNPSFTKRLIMKKVTLS